MAQTPFILSHHSPRDHHRCFAVAGLHICARCLGVYPVMLAVIAVQIALRTPMASSADRVLAFLLPLPALLDWARSRFNPLLGTNLLRLTTGILLGASLGRTLYLHLRQPMHSLAMTQLFSILGFAAAVEFIAWRHRQRGLSDPYGYSCVEEGECEPEALNEAALEPKAERGPAGD